ncbi:iron-containing alcohol dehydrogenase [Sphingobacterium bovistauri]|uniref:Iron-containing alcohol dehydrogenase n=1 Tax=Sphingobacterium bovistauri TaxID=2781959 RepID=A0ABS7Z3E3_9SPHI|nr:iron-containing alcohol dehydrogenase [Sphingobacterium bovistauri]MCA5004711.1 iron-containing alcohol dehydrogenase [Sphingobacterium bovistauri]
MSRNLRINFPRYFNFGNGVLSQLSEDISTYSYKEVLILSIAPLRDAIRPLIESIEEANVKVYLDESIVQEPTFDDFNRVYNAYKSCNIDAVIGIGGGSVLDVAKLVASLLNNDQSLEQIVGNGLLKKRTKDLICVPATAGTGSEVSPNAILVDYEGQKKGIISPFLVPDMVYADPLLTVSIPQAITAATGIDALTHCLEAYTNRYSQEFIDMYAYKGMQLISSNLVEAVKDGNNIEARSNVALGSLLGGFCLGPVNTAGVHALSYPLGSMFHLPHGLSNAILLPHVMEFNYQSNVKKYAEVALALGCLKLESDEETALSGISKIKQLMVDCAIPSRLRDLNIPKDAIPTMAADAMKITRLLVNNPREINLKDAIEIFEKAY